MLRPGEPLVAVAVRPGTGSDETYKRFVAGISRITAISCYCSVLHECWTSDMKTLRQDPVKICPKTTHSLTISGAGEP